jgi:hypothetical protein
MFRWSPRAELSDEFAGGGVYDPDVRVVYVGSAALLFAAALVGLAIPVSTSRPVTDLMTADGES